MATCPIKSLDAWKDLVKAQGEDIAHYLWDKHEGNVPVTFYQESKSGLIELQTILNKDLNTITDSEKKELQSTVENILLDNNSEDLGIKGGQSYIFLSEKDAERFSFLLEKNKGFPKEFKVTKQITKYKKDANNPLKFDPYNEYVDYYYTKTNNNKKSNLYDIIDKATGEIIANKVRVLHTTKDAKADIADKYGVNFLPTKVFSADRSISFALYRQKPSKAKYVAQAKKYLYDALKFLNKQDSTLNINLDKIEGFLDAFPEDMWDYINTSYSAESSKNVNASISLQNHIQFSLPKLGILKEIEKSTGIPLIGVSFKNYDRTGSLGKLFKYSSPNEDAWGMTITIDPGKLTKKQLQAVVSYYLKEKGYFKNTNPGENVKKFAEHYNQDYEELKKLVFGDTDYALGTISYNTTGNSDDIELAKWREERLNYDWQSVELFKKPYEKFNERVKTKITEKFKDKSLSNNISHLDYFFSGKFNWMNINFNNISGQYYQEDMETAAPVGVSYLQKGIINPFNVAEYSKPKPGENFLKEEEIFNRLAAIMHEPFHALHALSYGTPQELELRKAFNSLKNTTFGKEMLTQVFGSGYNGKEISNDVLYKEFTAFTTQLMLYPKEWITKTDLRSNDIYEFIEKVQNLQDKSYQEIVKIKEKIDSNEITITEEEKIKLNFFEKLYNYLVNALYKISPLSKKFFNTIATSNFITKTVIEDVFQETEESVTKTVKLPENVKKAKEEFLQKMEDLQSAINTLMQIDSTLFHPQNINDFFSTEESYDQESGSQDKIEKPAQTVASPKLIGLMKEFIKSIGVDYKLVSDIVVDGKKVDANGVALIMQKLIQVAEGKEDEALTEEAMHFAVEIIKQTNPKLYQTLLKEINGHPTLNEVVQLYGNDPQYQKDGRRDFLKLKEEAIAQVLANRLEDILGKSLWDKIVDFLKGLFFAKSGFDQASMDVLSGKIASVEDIDVSQGGVYFQLTPGEKVFNDLLTTSNQIQVVENGVDENGKPKTTYALGDLKAVRRVSDFAKDFYESVFPDIGKTDFEKALNDLKAEKGTAGHLDLEHAQKVLVDPLTGLLREEELDDSEYISELNPRDNAMYTLLKNNLRDRLNSFPVGTRFMSEVKIFDKKRKIAGTVDFLAITPEGKVNILDWKFMDLNTEYYEDVPWYKVKAWNIQMGKYKDIISTNYNVKNENFQQTRMIPILAKYSLADYELELLPRLLEIQIGDVNVKNIEEDYLLPIGITEEKTGEKRIDLLINKLNGVYKKLSEERVQESEKSAKAEQLNALYKAIRHLHIKENVTPLINQAKILNKQVSMLIKRHDAEFKDKNPSEVDQEKINAFAGMIRIHLEALQPYLDLDQLRFLLKEDTEENNKLKATLVSTVQNVKDYIYELQELDSNFGEKFNNTSSTPEKVVKGISKWFSSVSTLQVQNIQSLYKLANKAFFLSSEETLQEVKKLNSIKEEYDKWARSKRLSLNNYFDILTKKDKNELIDQFDKDFYTQLKSKIKNKNFKWILENIDQEAYKEYVDKKIEEEKDRIFSRPQVGTEEEITASIKKELAKVYSRYDLSGQNTSGWLLYREIKEFPKKETWESKEWKELNKPENAPAKAFYNYIIERNKYYQDINYLNGKAARKFLPWMRQGFVEGLVFEGKSRGLGEEFLRNISMDEGEAGYGQTDPVTGELINTIPKYFTKDLGEGYSKDLFKTMALYNEYAIKFKNLSDIEERSLQLLRAERNKKSIMSSTFGKMIMEDGEPKFNESNGENSKLLEDMIKGIIYQQKFVQSEVFDIALGKISGFGKNINKKLGMKIFPEDLEDRQLSLNKGINTLNTAFQMNVLGLNTLSSISNYFGGTANGLINAGTYFTKYDFIKTQMWFLTNKMKGTVLGKESLGEKPNKALAALDYFLPFIDNYNRDAARKLSLNKLDEQAVQDFLMIMMRKGEEAIQTVNFFAFLKNAVVIDNKIINVREYLKTTDEYKAFYSGTQAERKARHEKFEKDVEVLLDEKGVLQLGQIVDGEFTIPGVNKKSDSVMEFRRLVQSFTTDALGSMTEENRRLANMNVYSASAMVFKNWIPRLVDVRIGDMKYNAASDAYEWGRMRMIFGNLVAKDLLKSIKSLKAAIGGDGDVWLNQVRSLYERKQQEYFNNTGKTLNMTEDQFIALVNQNIKNQIVDVIILGSLLSLLAILKAFTPDDDEDPIVKNQYKFLLKATDKLTDELMYFYNPTSPIELISGKGGIFPAIGLLNNYSNFLTNFLKENYGIITENEEIQDDAKPIKYLMKSFPISSQAAGLLPMFYPELAKDLGIKMQGQYGIR